MILLRRAWRAEHVAGNIVIVARTPDADSQTGNIATEMPADVTQTVMPAMTAPAFDTDLAGGKREFIVCNECRLGSDLVIRRARADALSALVHERLRFQQPHGVARDRRPRDLAFEASVESERRTRALGQRVDKPKPGVMPGSGILRSGVAEPDDQSEGSFLAQARAPSPGSAPGLIAVSFRVAVSVRLRRLIVTFFITFFRFGCDTRNLHRHHGLSRVPAARECGDFDAFRHFQIR